MNLQRVGFPYLCFDIPSQLKVHKKLLSQHSADMIKTYFAKSQKTWINMCVVCISLFSL
jgi:hypothetical protein